MRSSKMSRWRMSRKNNSIKVTRFVSLGRLVSSSKHVDSLTQKWRWLWLQTSLPKFVGLEWSAGAEPTASASLFTQMKEAWVAWCLTRMPSHLYQAQTSLWNHLYHLRSSNSSTMLSSMGRVVNLTSLEETLIHSHRKECAHDALSKIQLIVKGVKFANLVLKKRLKIRFTQTRTKALWYASTVRRATESRPASTCIHPNLRSPSRCASMDLTASERIRVDFSIPQRPKPRLRFLYHALPRYLVACQA